MSFTNARHKAESAAEQAKAGNTDEAIALLAEAIALLAKEQDDSVRKIRSELSSIRAHQR
ncbi:MULTISPECIES: hypothetical protein [Cupriavidus]